MADYFSKCIEKYNSSFPVDWINSLDWESDDELTFIIAISGISDFYKELFILLSKSVLSGEYLDFEAISTHINTFDIALSGEFRGNIEDSKKKDLYQEFEKVQSDIRIAIKQYFILTHLVKNKYENRQDLQFSAFSQNQLELKNEYLRKFIKHILKFAISEHLSPSETENIDELILFRESIEEELIVEDIEIRFIYTILKDKCVLLIKKAIKKRPRYLIDFEIRSLDLEIGNSSIKSLLEKVSLLNNNSSEGNYIYEDIEYSLANSEYRLSSFVLLMKHYKSDNNSLEQINNLIRSFDQYYETERTKGVSHFDNYAFNSAKNYLYNCRFSASTSAPSFSFANISESLISLRSVQQETEITNFYPYKKAVSYLISKIEHNLNTEVLNIEETQSMINLLSETMPKLDESVKWCMKKKFYPFQLPFNECLFSCQNGDGNTLEVFVPSTFCKPIDYGKLSDEVESFKSSFNSLTAQFVIQKRIEAEKKELINIKDEIKASERKYIEILGIFTAIITFLFGSINIFSSSENLKSLIESSFALGIILMLFASSVYFLTIPRLEKFGDYLKHPRFWFFGISSIVYFIVLLKTIL